MFELVSAGVRLEVFLILIFSWGIIDYCLFHSIIKFFETKILKQNTSFSIFFD